MVNLSYQGLTTLNHLDISNVVELICNDNNLTSLPPLPLGLLRLDCGSNKLTSLPPLPDGLLYLDCQNNNLTSLSSLPDSLQSLGCENNNLTSMPLLPRNLKGLSYENNDLPFPFYIPVSGITMTVKEIRLFQHNKMRQDLELTTVDRITNDKDIRQQWKIWQYRLDGEKYQTCSSVIGLMFDG